MLFFFHRSPVEHNSFRSYQKFLIITNRKKKSSSIGGSRIEGKVYGNMCYYYKSFVGRGFKEWAQIASLVGGPYLSQEKRDAWIAVAKIIGV